MYIKENQVFDDRDELLCTFDPETWDRTYEEGVEQKIKMQVGRLLKPYVSGKKTLEGEDIKHEEKEYPTVEPIKEANRLKLPWEIFPDCPLPTSGANDKDEGVVKWCYKNQPDFYRQYYSQRLTIVDVEERANRQQWEDKGAIFYQRGLKISDCPPNANKEQREYFEEGFKKYMMSELDVEQ